MDRHGAVYKDSLGGYFKMFKVSGARYRTSALVDLANDIERLIGPTNTRPWAQNSVPAGMTYLGQFIDHDMTFMGRTLEQPGDDSINPDKLKQLRNPTLDLDSLYGEGYDAGLGTTINNQGSFTGPVFEDPAREHLLFDLPRRIHLWNTEELENFRDEWFEPQIPDSRNDENFLTAQLHVLFMNLHNKIAKDNFNVFNAFDSVRKQGKAGLLAFEHAQRELIFLYQLVIVNDFLKTFLDETVYDAVFGNGLENPPRARFLNYNRSDIANIPIEFSGAAFRFGHSLVRASYRIQDKSQSLKFFFLLTGRGRLSHETKSRNGKDITKSSIKFLQENTVNWEAFFDLTGDMQETTNNGRFISPFLVDDLRKLINEKMGNNNLLLRNLLRGKELDLPSAQDIIEHLNTEHGDYLKDLGLKNFRPLSFNEKMSNPKEFHPLRDELKASGLDKHTPLWLYILIEPQFNGSTISDADKNPHTRLGVLGSIIIAETFRMLLEQSNTSIYRDDPRMKASGLTFYAQTKHKWKNVDDFMQNLKMKDLIEFLYKH